MTYEAAQYISEILKAVGHPVRLQIIEQLRDGPMCVGLLSQKLDMPQSVISQQLGLMKDKQVLQCHREGTKVFYSIKNLNVIKLLDCVYSQCPAPEQSA
ncbi:MAG: winged helix-turn-helix transcriptional regulator [Phycisphaerae bacterium]|nr:winged helix-turn-helix transcriptional regulator [Phycisphaerae bacterium]